MKPPAMCSDFFVEARSKSLLQHGRQGVMWTGRAEDLSSERRCSNIRVQTGGCCSRGSDDVRDRRRSGTRGRLLLQRLVSVNGRRLRAGRAGRCVGVVGVAMELVLFLKIGGHPGPDRHPLHERFHFLQLVGRVLVQLQKMQHRVHALNMM
jgi:hypothetical protein